MGGDDQLTNGFINQGKTSEQRTGRRTGINDSRYVRNLNFRSRNWEIASMMIFNFIPVDGSYIRRPLINLYLMLGFAKNLKSPRHFFLVKEVIIP